MKDRETESDKMEENPEQQEAATVSESETPIEINASNDEHSVKKKDSNRDKLSHAGTSCSQTMSNLPNNTNVSIDSPLKTPQNQTRRRYPKRTSTQKKLPYLLDTSHDKPTSTSTTNNNNKRKRTSSAKKASTPKTKKSKSMNAGSIRQYLKQTPKSNNDESTSKSPKLNEVPEKSVDSSTSSNNDNDINASKSPTNDVPNSNTTIVKNTKAKSKRNTKDKSYLPFPKLSAGDTFITSFGIVKVVQDPFAPPSNSNRTRVVPLTKAQANAHNREKEKKTNFYKRAYVHNAEKLRKSRKKMRKLLLHLYHTPTANTNTNTTNTNTTNIQAANEKDSVTSKELPSNRVLFLDNKRDVILSVPLDVKGKFVRRTPTNVTLTVHAPIMEKLNDPLIPSDSKPDRIVECILISDRRKRTLLTPNGMKVDHQIQTPPAPMKLFLQRRLLDTDYSPNMEYFQCLQCGKHLSTRTGAKSHMLKQTCLTKTRPLPLWIPSPRRKRTYPKRDPEIDRIRNEKKRIRNAAEREKRYASLGIQPFTSNSNSHTKLDPMLAARRAMTFRTRTTSIDKEYQIMNQDADADIPVYLEVWTALQFRETKKKKRKRPPWVQFDPELSSMYPSTYRSLQFRANPIRRALPTTTIEGNANGNANANTNAHTTSPNPNNTTQKKKRRTPAQVKHDKEQQRLEKEREKKEKASSSQLVVDMMVLVEEVDTGRYPSMKRYDGEHSDDCVICKNQKGILYCCEFCSNASHLECLRERVVIRDPEPEEDFMCHACIQKILARRSRAEKRRLLKRDDALGKAGMTTLSTPTTTTSTTIHHHHHGTTPNTISMPMSMSMSSLANSNMVVHSSSLQTPNTVHHHHHTTLPLPPPLSDTEITSLRNELGVFPCPMNGPGGMICCDICAKSYSQVLADVSNEMEIQVLSMMGREMSEMVELLKDAQWRAQQAVNLSFENDARRLLLEEGDD